MTCPKSDCRIPRRSGKESPVCCSDAQRRECAAKTAQVLISKHGAVQNGQLFTFTILAASLVCSSPALADRGAHPADSDAYFAASSQAYSAPIRVAYNPRENRSRALPARGNACLQSALAGEPLPVNSRSMQDIIEHCGLLGSDLQTGASLQPVSSQPAAASALLAVLADAPHDPTIHATDCASCHSGY